VHIHGAAAKPSGIVEIARDRLREWTTFEGWTGASINTVVGGAESQDLPLPLLLAASVAITACGVWLYSRRRSERYPVTLAATIAGLVIVAWAVLDARWVSNLARQVEVTRERCGRRGAVQIHRERKSRASANPGARVRCGGRGLLP